MPTPFLSSEEYDERAHQLYNEGQYDEALTVLREGLALYPNAVELHVGQGFGPSVLQSTVREESAVDPDDRGPRKNLTKMRHADGTDVAHVPRNDYFHPVQLPVAHTCAFPEHAANSASFQTTLPLYNRCFFLNRYLACGLIASTSVTATTSQTLGSQLPCAGCEGYDVPPPCANRCADDPQEA